MIHDHTNANGAKVSTHLTELPSGIVVWYYTKIMSRKCKMHYTSPRSNIYTYIRNMLNLENALAIYSALVVIPSLDLPQRGYYRYARQSKVISFIFYMNVICIAYAANTLSSFTARARPHTLSHSVDES